MTKCKVKIITGFRRDQEYSIDGDEAHKAYYLFLNPDQRGIFKSGLALKGDQIQEIVPDWNGTMGWNEAHVINADDWNEIHRSGLKRTMNALLDAAKEVATVAAPRELSEPLTQLVEKKYPQLLPASVEVRSGTVKSAGELIGDLRSSSTAVEKPEKRKSR